MAATQTQIKKSLYLFSTVNEAQQFFEDLPNNSYIAHPVVYCTGNYTVYYNYDYAYTGAISELEPQPIHQ